MNDDRFDELMRDVARGYNAPPEPPLEAMWERVEKAHFGSAKAGAWGRGRSVPVWVLSGIGVAASLVLGVGIGRYVVPASSFARPDTDSAAIHGAALPAESTGAGDTPTEENDPYRDVASRYLGQTAALLAALPAEVRAGRPDAQFVAQAGDLLTTTRLLLDSPAASDPELRNLLDDLELILAQITRLPNKRRTAELDLITEALEQRDVIPRLRSVVAGIPASDI